MRLSIYVLTSQPNYPSLLSCMVLYPMGSKLIWCFYTPQTSLFRSRSVSSRNAPVGGELRDETELLRGTLAPNMKKKNW